RSHATTAVVAGPAAPKSTASASRHARLVSSGTGASGAEPVVCGGVRILSGMPAAARISQVASTTSTPMPCPGSATTVFIRLALLRADHTPRSGRRVSSSAPLRRGHSVATGAGHTMSRMVGAGPRSLGHALVAIALGAGLLGGCASGTALSIATTSPTGGADQIPATLSRPAGPGPFPAVVIMHDCSGLGPRSSGAPDRWANELVGRGYVVLIPDSFSTRGFPDGVCFDTSPRRVDVSPMRRNRDAYAALAHLRTLPFVDARRVGLMGGSHGGSTTLGTMAALENDQSPQARERLVGFGAAVVLPHVGRRACSVVRRAESFVAPLLVWRCFRFPSSWSASFIAAGIAAELSEPSSLMRAYTRVARPSLTGAPVTAFFATQFQCRVWTPISASVIVVRIRSPYAAGPMNLKWISPITKVVRSFLIICSIG